MNVVRSEAPSTISGVDIGRKISRFVDDRPVNWYRTRARAMSVPRMVATIVEAKAMIRLFETASVSPGRPSGLSHASIEKPRQVRFDRPVGSLKLKRIITATGAIR